jgi:TonB family protein
MHREFVFALFAILTTAFATGQQTISSTPPPTGSAPTIASTPGEQTAYYAGPGVTAPELLPVTVTDLATGHCKKLDGMVTFSVIVDATGIPRDVSFLRPTGTALDQEALRLVTAERFKPGTHNGALAATINSIDVNLKACTEDGKNEAGEKVQTLRLKSAPDQKLHLMESAWDATRTFSSTPQSQPGERDRAAGGISAPVVIKSVNARYTDEARAARLAGVCIITLIVDAQGMPQDVHVIRKLEPGLDQKALDAVRQYRFKPATKKDGTPVAARITVAVEFHLY